jgi:hypothetical protein
MKLLGSLLFAWALGCGGAAAPTAAPTAPAPAADADADADAGRRVRWLPRRPDLRYLPRRSELPGLRRVWPGGVPTGVTARRGQSSTVVRRISSGVVTPSRIFWIPAMRRLA